MPQARFAMPCTLCGLLLALPSVASAQNFAVQQPVIGRVSAATTISVPDRGTASLGGVSRAASGRTTYGPVRGGTSLGREVSGQSLSVGVFIHDFDAADRALLNAAAGSKRDSARAGVLSPAAERAWQSLARQSASGSSRERDITPRPNPEPGLSRAAHYRARAAAHAAAGRSEVARIYTRFAAAAAR